MKVELTDDEALVLFELLHEYGEKDDGRMVTVGHAAERNALWALSGALERELVAPFKENYADLLAGAEARRGEGWILVVATYFPIGALANTPLQSDGRLGRSAPSFVRR